MYYMIISNTINVVYIVTLCIFTSIKCLPCPHQTTTYNISTINLGHTVFIDFCKTI